MFISLIIALVVLGVVLYLVNMIPMDAAIKKIINILAIILAVLYTLKVLGAWSYLEKMP